MRKNWHKKTPLYEGQEQYHRHLLSGLVTLSVFRTDYSTPTTPVYATRVWGARSKSLPEKHSSPEKAMKYADQYISIVIKAEDILL